jgi:DNA polymerase II small subunit/DNA polymerase delta subunit B
MQSTDYVLSKHNYKSQYAQMYYARLMELAPLVKQRAKQQWPDVPGAVFQRPAECRVIL